jgi:hypothetical protein
MKAVKGALPDASPLTAVLSSASRSDQRPATSDQRPATSDERRATSDIVLRSVVEDSCPNIPQAPGRAAAAPAARRLCPWSRHSRVSKPAHESYEGPLIAPANADLSQCIEQPVGAVSVCRR